MKWVDAVVAAALGRIMQSVARVVQTPSNGQDYEGMSSDGSNMAGEVLGDEPDEVDFGGGETGPSGARAGASATSAGNVGERLLHAERGSTNWCRLAASTMTNAHARRWRPASGSNH